MVETLPCSCDALGLILGLGKEVDKEQKKRGKEDNPREVASYVDIYDLILQSPQTKQLSTPVICFVLGSALISSLLGQSLKDYSPFCDTKEDN